MKFSSKIGAFVGLILLLLLVISACSPNENNPDRSQENGGEAINKIESQVPSETNDPNSQENVEDSEKFGDLIIID